MLLLGGYTLAFYWAPEDADQGFSQKIFYLHVPIALTAYACFGWGAWKALRLLWTGDRRYDLESYTAVHMGVIFGCSRSSPARSGPRSRGASGGPGASGSSCSS